jgi:two-component system OmpR family response regulator
VRVLIVDDFPDTVEATSELMKLFGHECRTAMCAADALAAVVAFEPELVILDIGLPDLSGYDLARQLRARLVTPRPYLVAFTGWAHARSKALDAGFDYCLLKPADCRAFAKAVELAMQRLDAS